MKVSQIGSAALPPVSPLPRLEWSSKPTHTEVTRSGV